MVEAVEEMIGNIICTGDLHMDALAELEDTPCIKRIHRGGSGGPDSGRHLSSSLGVSGGSSGGTASWETGENDENLSITSCGLMG